jgi:hypothetical protein
VRSYEAQMVVKWEISKMSSCENKEVKEREIVKLIMMAE